MDYYDGNTVTALWNYAQNYAMSDNNWDTTFGPSTPGALNVTSGDTSGAKALNPTWYRPTPARRPRRAPSSADVDGLGTLNGDKDPYYDDCSDTNHTTTGALGAMTGKNIGDLLNASHVTWGWFQGGFAPTSTTASGCGLRLGAHQHRGRHRPGLLAAPQPVPVLRVDREPGPPARRAR